MLTPRTNITSGLYENSLRQVLDRLGSPPTLPWLINVKKIEWESGWSRQIGYLQMVLIYYYNSMVISLLTDNWLTKINWSDNHTCSAISGTICVMTRGSMNFVSMQNLAAWLSFAGLSSLSAAGVFAFPSWMAREELCFCKSNLWEKKQPIDN